MSLMPVVFRLDTVTVFASPFKASQTMLQGVLSSRDRRERTVCMVCHVDDTVRLLIAEERA
jgi:hypothetical protein